FVLLSLPTRLRGLTRSTLFPYTTVVRSVVARYPQLRGDERLACRCWSFQSVRRLISDRRREPADIGAPLRQTGFPFPAGMRQKEDRKSTRLNSSHVAISYAVFCLKQKKI